ncbi:vanadium-dependent haloperoxidase [Reyranella sp.]|uniref:vanadium-dependent haloperoxidase n=1 Tax=Reyranella sp. TaxID=1929291 RepID=UPI003D0FB8A3
MNDSLLPASLVLAASLAAALPAKADIVTDWNARTGALIAEAKMGTPPAVRVVAIVQTAAYGAVNSITQRYPDATTAGQRPPQTTSIEAAVAAAHRTTLLKLLPAQQASIDAAYQAMLAKVADGPARNAGIAAGERAAQKVLDQRLGDGASAPDSYRPHTTAGLYVPTVTPAVTSWPRRKTWLMSAPDQFRPAAPPALASATWTRDLNEVREIGGRTSARRTPEQTAIARFWEYSLPAIYFGVVRSVADRAEREVTRNALLYATVAQAMDDSLIAVMDAKYTYNYWRPVTAIRNADIDGNEATARDGAWSPLIDTPMHPEYPSAHSVLAAAVATVLKAEIGRGPMPTVSTASPTAKGAVRQWTNFDDFTQEVANARIWAGIHFRTATEIGTAMGRRIGEIAVTRLMLTQ